MTLKEDSVQALYEDLLTAEAYSLTAKEALLDLIAAKIEGRAHSAPPSYLLNFELSLPQRGSIIEFYLEWLRCLWGEPLRIDCDFGKKSHLNFDHLIEEILALNGFAAYCDHPAIVKKLDEKMVLLDLLLDRSGQPFHLIFKDERSFAISRQRFKTLVDFWRGETAATDGRKEKIMRLVKPNPSRKYGIEIPCLGWKYEKKEFDFLIFPRGGVAPFEARSSHTGWMMTFGYLNELPEGRSALAPLLDCGINSFLMNEKALFEGLLPIRHMTGQQVASYLKVSGAVEEDQVKFDLHLDKPMIGLKAAFFLKGQSIHIAGHPNPLYPKELFVFEGTSSHFKLKNQNHALNFDFSSARPFSIRSLPGYPHFWGHDFLVTIPIEGISSLKMTIKSSN